MATARSILIDVLNNIGESAQATNVPAVGNALTDPYQIQLLNFINHIKEEVEDAGRWRAQWVDMYVFYQGGSNQFTAPVVNGATSATLTVPFPGVTGTYQFVFGNGTNTNNPDIRLVTLTNGSPNVTWTQPIQQGTTTFANFGNTQLIVDQVTGATPNSRSLLIRQQNPKFGREMGLVFDVTSFGIPFLMSEIPQADLVYYNTVLNQTPVTYSTNYAVQDLGNDTVNLLVYPGANANRTIRVTMKVPQPRINNQIGTATYPWIAAVGLDSPLLLPTRVIELGASWYALSERGEELGTSSLFSEERYRVALDAAVAVDQGEQGDLQLIIA